ncbi:hypothetical protein ABB37_03089 [Leptomonas pyrrhocoris]|uniref:Uncharacterized protein n=1 Tax=Leptomonas pyrrhocoris TaxID=157538 RepID=A0A0N0DXX8_LEPPY|nr:hypothetical protein ABB37_03089 [Leptomonas pyrrhocoris]XP_015661911.1 hypothetical protein ABB37_03089 [Leptomonas pyrrhocoris]XP_015661912.1 hypothetical protein ABB37_03089 [Leptomonas pyrrhocoris]KPA83471.1 hypothetical protein ABB37_03089 [Leptomonas pyrrhocoris]KPA83472.1 hypothetical protein ABB37_03089 [Leptomonas pyrrhocoris]KPA83473.1 hypothetical protein ABB37_03089 [Leptomonas pyrrhocoris]|eukprot:XP_015661910.1 hypothetical protein ABB37_03089 [Leptomonas pyrrhocoris]
MQQDHQQQQATSSAMVSEPQFATVTFVGEDNVPGSTFRVPLCSTTSVSRLAKDAMKRLVLSRPSEDRHRQFPAIVVTEVYVGGTGTQPKAEVFAQDVVLQVVRVREEIIYMKLRTSPSSAVPSRRPSPPPLSEATQRSTVADANVDATASGDPSETAVARQNEDAKKDSKESAAAAASGHSSAVQAQPPVSREGSAAPATRPTSSAITEVKKEATQPVAASGTAVAHPKRPGWGPEAYEHFADNYVSTPGKRPRHDVRRLAAAATAAERHDTKKTKAEPKSKPTETTTTTTANEQETMRGLRWGPEASKSFPSNYVSSPEKLARLARQQQRRIASKETAQSAAAPPPTAPEPKAGVARELVYPVEQQEVGRTTVGHPVEREVITVEEDTASATPAVGLPKGWGAESLRYFDPNTYCDDPKKARLMPNMDLSRSIRQRRPASP